MAMWVCDTIMLTCYIGLLVIICNYFFCYESLTFEQATSRSDRPVHTSFLVVYIYTMNTLMLFMLSFHGF